MKIEITRQLAASYGAGVERGTVHDGVTLKGNRAKFRLPNGVRVTAPHGYYRVLAGAEAEAEPADAPTPLDSQITAAETKDDLAQLGMSLGVELDQRRTRVEMEDDLRTALATSGGGDNSQGSESNPE